MAHSTTQEIPPFPRIKQQEMPSNMRELAIDVVTAAYNMKTSTSHEQKAQMIGQTFERRYGPAWHCIVGATFGSFVIHEVGYFIQMEMIGEKGDIETVLLYKMGSADVETETKLLRLGHLDEGNGTANQEQQ